MKARARSVICRGREWLSAQVCELQLGRVLLTFLYASECDTRSSADGAIPCSVSA